LKKRVATPQVTKTFKKDGKVLNISQDQYNQFWHEKIKKGEIVLEVMPKDVAIA
jgi:hypothetical protein